MGLKEDRALWWGLYMRHGENQSQPHGLELASLCLNHELFTIQRRILEAACGGPLWIGETRWRYVQLMRHNANRLVVTAGTCTVCGFKAEDPMKAMLHQAQAHYAAALRDCPKPNLLVRYDQLLERERPVDFSKLLLCWWRRPWQEPGAMP